MYSIVTFFTIGINEPGWTSAVFLITIYTGLILMSIAVVGQYIGRIFEQGQDRPLYWVSQTHNISGDRFDQQIPEVKLAKRTVNAEQEPITSGSMAEPKVFIERMPTNGWANAAQES